MKRGLEMKKEQQDNSAPIEQLTDEQRAKVTGGTNELLADEMKGRIIGCDGRNNRTLEQVSPNGLRQRQLHRAQLGDDYDGKK